MDSLAPIGGEGRGEGVRILPTRRSRQLAFSFEPCVPLGIALVDGLMDSSEEFLCPLVDVRVRQRLLEPGRTFRNVIGTGLGGGAGRG